MKIDKIAILDSHNMFGEKLAERIRQVLPGTTVYAVTDIDALSARTDDIDVLITWPFIDKRVEAFCKGAPSLKWVHAFTAGVDGIMKSSLRNMDIQITATKGIHGPPISDHVIAFIFSFLRSFPALGECQRKKEWYRNHEHPEREELAGEESFDKTVGIIGLGTIGTCIAKKCKLLGMRVVSMKRTPAPSEWVDVCYATDELDMLLQESDFVILTVPLTDDTANMIGEHELRNMKKSAYLINVSRGGVVDEKALIKALQEKVIAGAGLDAVAEEPLNPVSPLWDLPNVIITPHISANSRYNKEVRSVDAIIDNITRYSKDEALLYVVDKIHGY
jgi:phosphoglycerate dehydrogenase-like enzyme